MASRMAAPSIGDLLQSLPQELSNEIYNLTFTAGANGIVDLENDKPFPQLLHVDHRSREEFAKSYYSATRFTFNPYGNTNMPVLTEWYRRLPAEHRAWLGRS